jgi:hypothetical protein
MESTIEIKNRYNNNIIFSHTCEDNSIKLTVETAVKNNNRLAYADLTSADLQGANL